MQVRDLNVHIHGRWLKYWRPSRWTLTQHGRPSLWTPIGSFGQNSKHAETMLNLYLCTCHTYGLTVIATKVVAKDDYVKRGYSYLRTREKMQKEPGSKNATSRLSP
ncbi:hypothetical protein Taro_049043, partial [Colocasia esculenta]|nr:hypothetical protein [Colocasia esculenta]